MSLPPNYQVPVPPSGPPADPRPPKRRNSAAVWGFVFAFLFWPAGLVLSIIGVNKAATSGRHKSLAVSGIVIAALIGCISIPIIATSGSDSTPVSNDVAAAPAKHSKVAAPPKDAQHAEKAVPPKKTGKAKKNSTADAAPAKKPAAPAVPKPHDYSGTGDDVVKISKPDGQDQSAIVTLHYTGSSNFVVTSLDGSMQETDLLVNEIGNYDGTVLTDADTTTLKISAQGSWRMSVKSVLAAEKVKNGKASGTGDQVVIWKGDAGVAKITHHGESNFVVTTYAGGGDGSLLVNEIGNYSGKVPWPSGPTVCVINADGTWSISVS